MSKAFLQTLGKVQLNEQRPKGRVRLALFVYLAVQGLDKSVNQEDVAKYFGFKS